MENTTMAFIKAYNNTIVTRSNFKGWGFAPIVCAVVVYSAIGFLLAVVLV